MTTPAAEWRRRIEELRDLAETTADPERKNRYLELADRWQEFVAELEQGISETARL